MNRLKRVLIGFGFGILLSLPITCLAFAASTPGDASKAAVCQGIDLSQGGNGSQSDCADNGNGVSGLLKLAINILSFAVGVIAIIFIIIGGLKYVTSQGESNNTAAAKNTIIYALVGLVMVALAQFIVRFTLNKATTATVCPPGKNIVNGVCK